MRVFFYFNCDVTKLQLVRQKNSYDSAGRQFKQLILKLDLDDCLKKKSLKILRDRLSIT